MRTRLLIAALAAACVSATAHAHFVLVSPAAALIQNRLGDPQKIAPCGGVSANPARGTPANPGVPSGAVTNIKGGTMFHLLLNESIFHPGHYRVALARTPAGLPPDPEVTTAETERGRKVLGYGRTARVDKIAREVLHVDTAPGHPTCTVPAQLAAQEQENVRVNELGKGHDLPELRPIMALFEQVGLDGHPT